MINLKNAPITHGLRTTNSLYALGMGTSLILLMSQAYQYGLMNENGVYGLTSNDVNFCEYTSLIRELLVNFPTIGALGFVVAAAQAEIMHINDFIQAKSTSGNFAILLGILTIFGGFNIFSSFALASLGSLNGTCSDYWNGQPVEPNSTPGIQSETKLGALMQMILFGGITSFGSVAYLLLTTYFKQQANNALMQEYVNATDIESTNVVDESSSIIGNSYSSPSTNSEDETQSHPHSTAFSFFSSVASTASYTAVALGLAVMYEALGENAYLGMAMAAAVFDLLFMANDAYQARQFCRP